jgi:hypothetical protein
MKQAAEKTVRYYRLRFQIDFHLNMSVAGVNLLRLMAGKSECSIRNYRRLACNRFLTARIFSKFGLSGEWSLSDREGQPVLETGHMAT